MNRADFEKRLKEKFKDENYSIVYAGKNSYENSVLKCLDCGRRIEVNTSELFRTRRKHICSKCNYKRIDTQRNEDIILKRLDGVAHDISFFMEKCKNKKIRYHKVNFTCNKCGRINTKFVGNFLQQKYNCGYCEGTKQSKDNDSFLGELHEKYGNKFILLTEYINANTSIKIKCNNCGFIREVKPPAILSSGFCPKCDKKMSKGEKVIEKYLEEHDIPFITQMYFSNWDIGIHYFDFYIPSYNLVLEFHGRQHYEFIDYFHKTEQNFQYRKNKDLQKKEKAIINGLNYVSISYLLMEKLNFILNYIFNSTTIPQGSRGKCFEIETIQDLDKDIVCSL